MGAPKLTATTPFGLYARRTFRAYHFIVIAKDHAKGPGYSDSAWSTTRPLAEKRAAEYRRSGYRTVEIFPIDSPAQAPQAPPPPTVIELVKGEKTREEWLNAATRIFRPWFDKGMSRVWIYRPRHGEMDRGSRRPNLPV